MRLDDQKGHFGPAWVCLEFQSEFPVFRVVRFSQRSLTIAQDGRKTDVDSSYLGMMVRLVVLAFWAHVRAANGPKTAETRPLLSLERQKEKRNHQALAAKRQKTATQQHAAT